jgi:hypothetical protein
MVTEAIEKGKKSLEKTKYQREADSVINAFQKKIREALWRNKKLVANDRVLRERIKNCGSIKLSKLIERLSWQVFYKKARCLWYEHVTGEEWEEDMRLYFSLSNKNAKILSDYIKERTKEIVSKLDNSEYKELTETLDDIEMNKFEDVKMKDGYLFDTNQVTSKKEFVTVSKRNVKDGMSWHGSCAHPIGTKYAIRNKKDNCCEILEVVCGKMFDENYSRKDGKAFLCIAGRFAGMLISAKSIINRIIMQDYKANGGEFYYKESKERCSKEAYDIYLNNEAFVVKATSKIEAFGEEYTYEEFNNKMKSKTISSGLRNSKRYDYVDNGNWKPVFDCKRGVEIADALPEESVQNVKDSITEGALREAEVKAEAKRLRNLEAEERRVQREIKELRKKQEERKLENIKALKKFAKEAGISADELKEFAVDFGG